MSRKYVIMFVAENVEVEILGVWNIDEIVMSKETVSGQGPVGFGVIIMGDKEGVGVERGQDVGVELFQVH